MARGFRPEFLIRPRRAAPRRRKRMGEKKVLERKRQIMTLVGGQGVMTVDLQKLLRPKEDRNFIGRLIMEDPTDRMAGFMEK